MNREGVGPLESSKVIGLECWILSIWFCGVCTLNVCAGFALWLFALLAALAALAVIGQAVVRWMRPLREQRALLGSLGFTGRQLVASAALRGLVIGAIGAVIAVVIAIAASAFFPLGPLRHIDPVRGISLDGFVLGVGCAAITSMMSGGGPNAESTKYGANRPMWANKPPRAAATSAP